MALFLLKHFSEYNKNASWIGGNELLMQIAQLLHEHFKASLVFRIFGDDFAILCKEPIETQKFEEALEQVLQDTGISYEKKDVNLQEVLIKNIKQIEEL